MSVSSVSVALRCFFVHSNSQYHQSMPWNHELIRDMPKARTFAHLFPLCIHVNFGQVITAAWCVEHCRSARVLWDVLPPCCFLCDWPSFDPARVSQLEKQNGNCWDSCSYSKWEFPKFFYRLPKFYQQNFQELSFIKSGRAKPARSERDPNLRMWLSYWVWELFFLVESCDVSTFLYPTRVRLWFWETDFPRWLPRWMLQVYPATMNIYIIPPKSRGSQAAKQLWFEDVGGTMFFPCFSRKWLKHLQTNLGISTSDHWGVLQYQAG